MDWFLIFGLFISTLLKIMVLWFHKEPLTSTALKVLYSEKSLKIIQMFFRQKNCLFLIPKGSLWNQKMFLYGVLLLEDLFLSLYSNSESDVGDNNGCNKMVEHIHLFLFMTWQLYITHISRLLKLTLVFCKWWWHRLALSSILVWLFV